MPLSSSDEPNQPLTPGRVRKLLKARGLSQAACARGAGIGEAELSRIVARDMQPTAAQSRRLLEVLAPGDDATRTAVKLQVAANA